MIDMSFIKMLRKQAELTDNTKDRFMMLRAADELEVGQDNWASLFCRILNDNQNFLDAERYRWLRDGSWDVPQEEIAPAIVLCDGKMSTHVWLTGDHVDQAVDSWMTKEFKRKETKSE